MNASNGWTTTVAAALVAIFGEGGSLQNPLYAAARELRWGQTLFSVFDVI